MEINPHQHPGGVWSPSGKKKPGKTDSSAKTVKTGGIGVGMALRLDSARLESLLQQMPDVRESILEFGNELVSRDDYPLPEQVDELAQLLTDEITLERREDSPPADQQ